MSWFFPKKEKKKKRIDEEIMENSEKMRDMRKKYDELARVYGRNAELNEELYNPRKKIKREVYGTQESETKRMKEEIIENSEKMKGMREELDEMMELYGKNSQFNKEVFNPTRMMYRELERLGVTMKKPLVEEKLPLLNKPEKIILSQDINNKIKELAEEILTAYKPLEGILAHDINAFYNKKGAISGKIDNLHKYITSKLDELINNGILFKDDSLVGLPDELEKDEKTTLKKIIYFKVETDRIKEIMSSQEALQIAGVPLIQEYISQLELII